MRAHSRLLPFSFLAVLLLAAGGAAPGAEGPDSFIVTRVDGDVLHVLDGQPPRAVPAGAKIRGGRLAVMEDSAAEVVFPNGTTHPVPQNTLLALDPQAASLENACAAAGGIRDQSALILAPSDNQELQAGRPFQALIAINPSQVPEPGLALCCTTLEDMQFTKGQVLAEFTARTAATGGPGKGDFLLYRLEVPAAPAQEGDFKLFLRSVAGVASKRIGKDQAIIVVAP
jgi:hypothetical protein